MSQHASASTAWEKSCYNKIDYTISDDLTVYEAVQRFSAYNVGALVTINGEGDISGVISERDYINKIALLGKTSKETRIKEIATTSHNLNVATKEDTINSCMEKMLSKDIRHLPLVDESGKAIGLLSIKDLFKEVVQENNETISRLSQFALGKGALRGRLIALYATTNSRRRTFLVYPFLQFCLLNDALGIQTAFRV